LTFGDKKSNFAASVNRGGLEFISALALFQNRLLA
jgi:hypothetical protein